MCRANSLSLLVKEQQWNAVGSEHTNAGLPQVCNNTVDTLKPVGTFFIIKGEIVVGNMTEAGLMYLVLTDNVTGI